MHVYNKDLGRLPVERRPPNLDIVTNVMTDLCHIITFTAGGRNIFNLPAILSNMLANTSLKDIRISDIKLPFGNFYLSFEGALDIGLPGKTNVIDGAYISRVEDKLSFYITSKIIDQAAAGRTAWIENAESHFFAPFEIHSADQTLEELCDEAVRSNEIAVIPNQRAIKALHSSAEDAREAGLEVTASDVTGYERASLFNRDALPNVRSVLALIANAICLLSTKPNMHEAWPEDASKTKMQALREANTTRRTRKVSSSLAEDGIFPVRRVLINLGEPGSASDASVPTGLEVEAHWRRGHWRRQRYGEDRADTRLIWIKPVLVRRDKGKPIGGRIYDVQR